MAVGRALRRFAPGFVAQLYYFFKFRAMVSHRAEMEISGRARLGRGTVVGSFSKIKIAGDLRTGRGVQIASGCFVEAGSAGLDLGDHVLLGPGVAIVTTGYRYERLGVPLPDQGGDSRPVRIGDRSWIGANSVVLPGVTIGEDVIASAGSVVASDVPDGSIIQGNPAQVIFTRR